MQYNDSINYAKKITPGTMMTAGRRIGILTVLGGNVELTLSSGDKMTIGVSPGYQEFDFSVVKITAGGLTTATATFTNLS